MKVKKAFEEPEELKSSEEAATIAIAHSASIKFRLMWILLVLSSCAVFSFHLSKLITKFNSQDVSVNTVPTGTPFEFPDVHFCPQMPFSYSIIRHLANTNNSEWSEVVEEIRLIEDSIDQLNITSNYSRQSMKLQAFWETLGPSRLQKLLSQPAYENFLLLKVNGQIVPYTELKVTPHWTHLFCYSYQPPTSIASVDTIQFLGGSIILQTPPRNASIAGIPLKALSFIVSETDANKPGGMFLIFSPKGHYPSMYAGATQTSASTGEESTIGLHQSIYTALPTNQRPCTDPKPPMTFVDFLNPGMNITYKYSRWTCLNDWMARKIHHACKCSLHELPLPASLSILEPSSRQGCGDLRPVWRGEMTMSEYTERQDCVSAAMMEVESQMKMTTPCCSRLAPCNQTSYDHNKYSFYWPLSTLSLEMAMQYIKPRSTEMRNKGYEVHGLDEIYSSYSRVYNESDEITFDTVGNLIMRENFLSLHIRRVLYVATVRYESLAYPITNLLSDFGGIIGMYLGVSVLSVFSLFEFFSSLSAQQKVGCT